MIAILWKWMHEMLQYDHWCKMMHCNQNDSKWSLMQNDENENDCQDENDCHVMIAICILKGIFFQLEFFQRY